MVGIDLQESPEAVQAFGKTFHIPFPLLLDADGAVQKRFGVRGHPSTVVIDRRGQIVARVLGERDWQSPPARELVRSLLEAAR